MLRYTLGLCLPSQLDPGAWDGLLCTPLHSPELLVGLLEMAAVLLSNAALKDR